MPQENLQLSQSQKDYYKNLKAAHANLGITVQPPAEQLDPTRKSVVTFFPGTTPRPQKGGRLHEDTPEERAFKRRPPRNGSEGRK